MALEARLRADPAQLVRTELGLRQDHRRNRRARRRPRQWRGAGSDTALPVGRRRRRQPDPAWEESESHFDKAVICSGGTLFALIRVPPRGLMGSVTLQAEFDDGLSSNYRILLRGRTLP